VALFLFKYIIILLLSYMAKKTKKNTTKKVESKTEIKATENKSQLDNLILADGKKIEDPDIQKVKELEEILGIKKMNPFGTSNIEVFKEKLAEMTMLDLQNMCEKLGIFGSGSRMELKEKLMRQFKQHSRGTISMATQNPAFNLDPNNPEHAKTIRILKEL
jgi:hypothetical protein